MTLISVQKEREENEKSWLVAARLSITAASTLVRDLENTGIFCIFSVYLVLMTSCSAPS